MRRRLQIFFVSLCACLPSAPIAAQDTDRAGITAAALDYIEGFYTGDPARMERALHPDLAKRIMRIGANGKATLEQMSSTQLVDATRSRQGMPPPSVQQKDVTIFDVFGNTATAKIVANQWVDYLHLVKWEGRWVIVNVLWEMKPRG